MYCKPIKMFKLKSGKWVKPGVIVKLNDEEGQYHRRLGNVIMLRNYKVERPVIEKTKKRKKHVSKKEYSV